MEGNHKCVGISGPQHKGTNMNVLSLFIREIKNHFRHVVESSYQPSS